MPVTVYGTVAGFTARLPVTAWGARTTADVLTALATASADMDDCFRGRWTLPFVAVGGSVARRCEDHARYLFMGGRGFSPVSGADQDIIRAEEEYQEWIDKVQRRVIFPDVTTSDNPSALEQPVVLTRSTINDNGVTATNRRW